MHPSRILVLAILSVGAIVCKGRSAAIAPAPSDRSDPDPVYFEERIQPIFAANCGTSGCHGAPGSGRLLLERPDFQGRYSQEATAKNLATALQFVEFGKPLESRLLLKPLKVKDGGLPHTGAQYDFGKTSEEYKIFADWIAGVELTNVAPIADAGIDRSGKRGEEIALDGSHSRERRGGSLQYRWIVESKPEGSTPILKHADTANPSFRADRDGAYTMSLVVDNGVRASDPSTTTVTIDSLPFATLEAEGATIEHGFYVKGDAAASGNRALAVDQSASGKTPAEAQLHFTLPSGGGYRVFGRIAATPGEVKPDATSSDGPALLLSLDAGKRTELSAEPGSGYKTVEIEALSGDGALPSVFAHARLGEVEIQGGELTIASGSLDAARLQFDEAASSIDLTARWLRPESNSGDLSTQELLVELDGGAEGSVVAGIEFGKNRYAIERVKNGARTLLAEKRLPLRPDQAYRSRLDVTEDRIVLQSDSGEVIETPRGAWKLAPPALVGRGSFAITSGTLKVADKARSFDLSQDALPSGFLRAGEHSIRLFASSETAPRIDQFFVAPRTAAATTPFAAREIRALYLDLLGRTPTPIERLMAEALPRDRLAEQLVHSLEFYENLYQLELYYFLLLDNFHPRTPQLEALPSRLLNKETDLRGATREIVISQYFNARNPGNDTFVTVVLEQLLGITVQDDTRLLETGKKMYDGYKATVFNEAGASQSDFVGIVLKQPAYATKLMARHYERLVGSPPNATELASMADRFRAEPASYPAIVLEWVKSDAYRAAAKAPRRKSDFMWIRGVFVDLLGRKPTFEEFRNFRNAVQALADSGPLRSVLSKVMLDSGQVALPSKQGLDAKAFVNEVFERFLARDPTPSEEAAFVGALADPSAEPRLVLQAILSSAEYQMY